MLASRARRPASDQAGQRGFSLIEILVVITIIGLLMGFGAMAVGKYRETGRVTDCKARIQSLALWANSYAERTGDYPPDRLAALGVGDAGNEVNQGIEACVAALRHRDYAGSRPNEQWLGNSDGDNSEQLSSLDGSSALLEVFDPWENPLVYCVAAHYDQQSTALLDDGTLAVVVDVSAVRNPLTGAYHHFESFQIRSAGPDGLMDTEDDLANFESHAD